MDSVKKYLLYRLKRTFPQTLIFALVCLAITFTTVYNGVYSTRPSSGLAVAATVLAIFATLIPMLELAQFKNRRNLDTLYFFPIKREKMALTHFLSGFIQFWSVYTVCFIELFAILAYAVIKHGVAFSLIYLLPYYFLSLLLGLAIYSFFSFIFMQGNTVFDGVLFCVLYIAVFWVVATFVSDLFYELELSEVSAPLQKIGEWLVVYVPVNNMTVLYQTLVEPKTLHSAATLDGIREYSAMFAVWGIIGIACIFGYFYTFVKSKPQDAGEISSSPFGYKLLLPLFFYSFASCGDLVLVLIALGSMVVGYTVYRRGFKFKRADIIVMACAIVPVIIGIVIYEFLIL